MQPFLRYVYTQVSVRVHIEGSKSINSSNLMLVFGSRVSLGSKLTQEPKLARSDRYIDRTKASEVGLEPRNWHIWAYMCQSELQDRFAEKGSLQCRHTQWTDRRVSHLLCFELLWAHVALRILFYRFMQGWKGASIPKSPWESTLEGLTLSILRT